MSTAYESICSQQKSWACQRGIRFDEDGYTLSLDDNLLLPLLPEVRKEFKAGKGDELGAAGIRGKMQALHSSSALVVNIFQYWANRDISEIASACGTPHGMTRMRFERTYPTTLGGTPPHLDVEFSADSLKPLVIESKFTEPYRRHTKRAIKDRHLDVPGLWTGLTECEKLVRRIREEERGRTSFGYLDAPQLLKHILGLTKAFGASGFSLLYLWYEIPSPEARSHRTELNEFMNLIGQEVEFRQMTHQELFQAIRECHGVSEGYIRYLTERYFSHLID
jgi:hypothetical protein